MPRRGNIAKRDVLADPVYNSKWSRALSTTSCMTAKRALRRKLYTKPSTS